MKLVFKITITLALLLTLQSWGQVVTTEPAFPMVDEPVTIIFDATQGNGGLAGYTGDVYAHTGVITNLSVSGSDWKYVKSGWGENIPDCKLTRVAPDLYELEIQPSIREYYGVVESEQILKMAFVFRSATEVGGEWITGRDEDGGDIFTDVYEPGLNVAFFQPTTFPFIVQKNEEFIVKVKAFQTDSIRLYVDEELVNAVEGDTLIDTLSLDTYGNFNIRAIGSTVEETDTASFDCNVRKPVEIAERPAGIRDGINYPDASTATLSLLAPGKEFVYVLGDFNDWKADSNYYMKMTPDGERFWLEIDGLTTGKEYIFQYLVDGTLRVGDPYADKVSDPNNDPYISNQTYPGLIEYPYGKTSEIATVLQTDQTPYQWEVENFQPPTSTKLVIYECLVRDFTTKHSYEAVMDSLDYLQRLGINALELMPVNEFEGNSGWGYNPNFYFAPDKYYGPKDRLKQLIDECHKRGIAVIMDIVLNHAYSSCPFVRLYFDGTNPTADNPWFNVQSNFTNPDAQWGNDFNHESPYTQALVDSINSYWMSEYKMDGFRFDFTKGFGNNIKTSSDPWGSLYDADRIRLLERMSDEIWARKSDAIIIFEHLAENSEEKELANYGILLWGNMNYNYGEAAMGYTDNGGSDFSWISYKKRGWNDPNVVGYMESHDEERLMYKCITYGDSEGSYSTKDTLTAMNRIMANAMFFFPVPGPKMIWQFEEYGYDVSIDYNGRIGEKPVLWSYLENNPRKYMYDYFSSLIKLKNEYPVFSTTNYNLYVSDALKRMVLYGDEMNVVIIGNFGLADDQIQFSFPGMGTYYDYFKGDSLVVDELIETIPLKAGEYRMYTTVKLQTPQIGTGIEENGPGSNLLMTLYPNPASQNLDVLILPVKPGHLNENLELEVINTLGSVVGVYRISDSGATFRIDVSDLSQGLYFVRLSNSSQVLSTSKFMKAD